MAQKQKLRLQSFKLHDNDVAELAKHVTVAKDAGKQVNKSKLVRYAIRLLNRASNVNYDTVEKS